MSHVGPTMTAPECEEAAETLLLEAVTSNGNRERAIAEAQAWATLALSIRTRDVNDALVQIGFLL